MKTRSFFVGISSSADGSKLRTDTFNNISYIVVPIVSAVGDRVWWPINSPTPVLILSSVLATHAATRNFRPVVMGHPKISGDYVSANSPQILQDYSFGFMFNSIFDDGRVKVEAWLDPIRAKEVGAAAENVIARLQAGENVEVSEGNAILAISEEGEFNGKKYGARWISAVSDHLAMLDVGEIGACDNKMGCGRLDVSTQSQDRTIIELVSANSSKIATKSESKLDNTGVFIMKDNIFARMLTKIRASMSNNDLRWKLYQVLSDTEPGVQYIDDEDVEAKTVRYVVMICYGYSWDDSSEREYHTYQRTFKVDADNNVTVNNDRIELIYDETKAWVVKPAATNDVVDVIPETVMEPMAATTATAATTTKTAKSCKCHDEDNNKGENTMIPTVVQKNLATQLITSTAAPFEESDRGVLEAMSEDKLKILAAKFEEIKTPENTTTAPVVLSNSVPINTGAAPIDPNSVTITREEYASIRAAADAHAAQVAARKAQLVAALKVAQTGLLETDLNEMTMTTLEKLAVSFKIDTPTTADYSVRGVPSSSIDVSAVDKINKHKPTDTWAAARANRDKVKQQTGDAN